MDVKELRRVQLARETLGYLAVPVLYAVLMVAGIFTYQPGLAVLTLILVLLLILQSRAGRLASTIAVRSGERAQGVQTPAAAVEAADRCFLSFVSQSTSASIAGYLVFLACVDGTLRSSARGEPAGFLLIAGAILGIAIVVGGKEAARRRSWRGFAGEFRELWDSPTGMARGKRVRTAAEYLDWRTQVNARP